MIGIERNKENSPKCITNPLSSTLEMHQPPVPHDRVNCIEMAHELNHIPTDSVQKRQINSNSMPHQSAFVNSVQNRKKHRDKKLLNVSSKVKMGRSGKLVDSTNDNNYIAHISGTIEYNAAQCTIQSPAVTRNHSESCVRTVNRSINEYRQRPKTNCQWSTKTNVLQALLMCFAILAFGGRNTLVSANAVTMSPLPAADNDSISATINESAATMSSIIENHLMNTIVTTTEHPLRAAGICSSRDIRNSVKAFRDLEGCRIIEGFLMITLIDKVNESDYDELEFPELNEISEFFLLYRANGLKSLGKLFPNLRVIRGNQLINDFSFIVFEMMHLQEIGLKSLSTISRGSIRVEKNPTLCFVDTIDWSRITIKSVTTDNIMQLNKPVNECPTCPGTSKPENNSDNKNPVETQICPIVEDMKQSVCWNRQTCQQICSKNCTSCNKDQCCDDLCIGCDDSDPKKCLSCRYASYQNRTGIHCLKECPSDTYSHYNHRCISAEECRNADKPYNVKYEFKLQAKPFIPFSRVCAFDCPAGYYPEGISGQRRCVKCQGSCKKECPGANIDSIAAAQRYRGCTHIAGTFQISIQSQGGHNVVRELNNFLSDIEVIEGGLIITRSHALLSLSFFKSLRIIRGQAKDEIKDSDARKDQEDYGIKVYENLNLQSLFSRNVTVEKGRMFFHFNPKLCMHIIQEFKNNVSALRNEPNLRKSEVAPDSNGDKIACNVTNLKVDVAIIKHDMVLLKVQPLLYEDVRQLLGYLVYYMPAPHRNVTMFDGRDACSSDGWQVDDIGAAQISNKPNGTFPVLISRLQPYTQYAYYLRTYTVASEPRGGITDIKYFRTNPHVPKKVTKLSVVSNGSSELIVKWGPPLRANGNLTTYIIKCTMVDHDPQLLQQRNYCKEPLDAAKISSIIVPKPNEIKPINKPDDLSNDRACDCDGDRDGKQNKISDKDIEQLNEFEDELQNIVYIKHETASRERRDVYSFVQSMAEESAAERHSVQKRSDNSSASPESVEVLPTKSDSAAKMEIVDDKVSKMDKANRSYTYIYEEVNATVTSFTLSKLRHFTYYTVSVKACREGSGERCGTEMMDYHRTEKIDSADNVEDVRVEHLSSTSNHSAGVRLYWKSPENPNGMIVSYTVRIDRVDTDRHKAIENCVSYMEYLNDGGSYAITDLPNGNYSFEVSANSLSLSNIRYSKPVFAYINERTITLGIIVMIVLCILLLSAAIVVIYWFYRRKYGPPDSGLKLIASVNPEYVSMQYTPDEWEIPREKIIQLRELGQGSFGMVYEGIVVDLDRERQRIRCAIKTVNENATDRERINFLKEAAVMKAFDTHHVVRLLGVVSRGQPVLVIMELMVNGDLKGYLREHRPESGNEEQPPTLRRILQMAIEISDGMAYLSAKKFVHRDLAARNCMVAEDLTVKIGDFGMTRDIYETDYYRKGTKGLLPVRWMAPESLKDGVFSSSSDVFSFGIVLWEMATLASQPYQGLSNDQVLRYVIDGGVMERPDNCPEKLYTMMCRCWQHRPSARPTFIQIVSMLLDEASTQFREVSFYHSPSGQELLQLPQHQLLEVVDVRTPLRAQEENFSVGADEDDEEEDPEDPEDPNSYLMENRNIRVVASASGPSNSPMSVDKSAKTTVPSGVSISSVLSRTNIFKPLQSFTSNLSESSIAQQTVPAKMSSFGRNGARDDLVLLAPSEYDNHSHISTTAGDNSIYNSNSKRGADAYKLFS